jgi:lipopolysaccharide biosynthesis regulator YciM
MEAEASRILLSVLFLVIGIALFAGAIATRLQMEKEFKEGTQSLPRNFFLYLNSSGFSEKGNALRKKYNIIYSVLTVYSLALFIFMKAND